jgi:hypothetical protein
MARREIMAVWCISLCLVYCGCGVLDVFKSSANRAIDSINAAIQVLDKQAGQANSTFGDIKDVLVGLKKNLDDETYKNQVDDLIGRTGQIATIAYSGSLDFTRTRVREDLVNLIATIKGEPPVARVPVLANSESPKIDFRSTGRQSLTIVGWNLDVAAKDPAKYAVVVENANNSERVVDAGNVAYQGQYAVSVNVSENGVVFQPNDSKLQFKGYDPPFEVLIVNSNVTPASPEASPVPPIRYVLVFMDHEDPTGMLWKVLRTDITQREIGRGDFKRWCVRFAPSEKNIVSQEEVAGDEHFKLSGGRNANWWTSDPYNLPPLIERWFQIMDDERWYVYSYRNKSMGADHLDR